MTYMQQCCQKKKKFQSIRHSKKKFHFQVYSFFFCSPGVQKQLLNLSLGHYRFILQVSGGLLICPQWRDLRRCSAIGADSQTQTHGVSHAMSKHTVQAHMYLYPQEGKNPNPNPNLITNNTHTNINTKKRTHQKKNHMSGKQVFQKQIRRW